MLKRIKLWFDAEADFLEVRFSDAAGYERETANDAVMERLDAQGERYRLQHPWRQPFQEGKAIGGGIARGMRNWRCPSIRKNVRLKRAVKLALDPHNLMNPGKLVRI